MKSQLPTIVVKAPGFGDRRKEQLEDIAVLTGGTVIDLNAGMQLKQVTLTDLGQADTVEAGKEFTLIVGGKGDKEALQARIEELKQEIDTNESDYDKEKLQERLAKLSGGVAVIRIGAAT